MINSDSNVCTEESQSLLKLALIGEITASAFHDMRNLLAINTLADHLLTTIANGNLSSQEITENLKKYLGHSALANEQAVGLINHVLFFNKEANKRETVNLNDLFDTLLVLVRDQLNSQSIQAERDLGNLHIVAIPDSLKIIFMNLIINAIQAMKVGGILIISAKKIPGQMVIRIADTGRGISSEDLKKMFKSSFTTKENGNGFGLMNIKKEVLNLGGEIFVKSELGKGTTFSVYLPLD